MGPLKLHRQKARTPCTLRKKRRPKNETAEIVEKSTHLRGSGAHLGRAFGCDRVTKNSPAATTATTTATTTTAATTATSLTLKIDGEKYVSHEGTRTFWGPFCRDAPNKMARSHLIILSFRDTTSARGVAVNALDLKSGGQKAPGSNPLSGIKNGDSANTRKS